VTIGPVNVIFFISHRGTFAAKEYLFWWESNLAGGESVAVFGTAGLCGEEADRGHATYAILELQGDGLHSGLITSDSIVYSGLTFLSFRKSRRTASL